MTLYLPSAQAKKGDEYLDDARALRDLWRGVIPRGELTSLQNRLTMSACYILVQIWFVFTYCVCLQGSGDESRVGLEARVFEDFSRADVLQVCSGGTPSHQGPHSHLQS
jgi:hypothetical protein